MQADPADQRRLLDLQRTDTSLTQLAHRRGRLPEETEVSELRDQVNQITDRQARQEAAVSDLDRDISRVEREIEQVRARTDKDKQLQSSGSVSAKQLEGIEQELASLARRESELEEQELALMEQREEASNSAAADGTALAAAQTRLSDAESRYAASLTSIDTEVAELQAARAEQVDRIPPELLKLYDKIRKTKPIAVALLRQRRCESCRIEQSGAELAQLKSAVVSDVMRCEDCGAILVRTEESGL